MLTEVDIERIMAAQRKLTESLAEPLFSKEIHELPSDYELYEILDVEISVSETNGLM